MDKTTTKRFEEVFAIAENALIRDEQIFLPFYIVDAYNSGCEDSGIALELKHQGRTYFLQLQADGTFTLAVMNED